MENNTNTQAVDTTQIDLTLNDLVQTLDKAVKGLKNHILPVEDEKTYTKEQVLFVLKCFQESMENSCEFELSGCPEVEVDVDESCGNMQISGSVMGECDLSMLSEYDYDITVEFDGVADHILLLEEFVARHEQAMIGEQERRDALKEAQMRESHISQLEGNAYDEAQND